MLLETFSTTALPPPLMEFGSAGHPGLGSTMEARPRVRCNPKPNISASTAAIKELSFLTSSDSPVPVVNKTRLAAEVSQRLQFLKIEAKIERIPFSDASLADFQAFMREISPRTRPSLFLHDNGNLRALWKNDRREQIGLEFLGDGNIQFVIFKQRRGTLGMARIAGVDSRDRISGHIKVSGAHGLLFG